MPDEADGFQAKEGTTEHQSRCQAYEHHEDEDGAYFQPVPRDGQPFTSDCRRCGEPHECEDVKIRQMTRPIRDSDGTWLWWWMCPNGGGPTLLIYDRDPEAEIPEEDGHA